MTQQDQNIVETKIKSWIAWLILVLALVGASIGGFMTKEHAERIGLDMWVNSCTRIVRTGAKSDAATPQSVTRSGVDT